jgi:antitoxin VapB
MNLQIRDPRARDMARKLAVMNDCTMTEAVVDALDFRIKSVKQKRPLAEVAAELAAELRALSTGPGHTMTKDEIDEMWGH